jgi:hypothetical protein
LHAHPTERFKKDQLIDIMMQKNIKRSRKQNLTHDEIRLATNSPPPSSKPPLLREGPGGAVVGGGGR